MYKRVFIFCTDSLYRNELLHQLSSQLPEANLVSYSFLVDAVAALKDERPFDLVLVSAKAWSPGLFVALKETGQCPPLVFLLEDGEKRNPSELYTMFRYCLQAPFREHHVKWVIAEISKADVLRLPHWQFLLLQNAWKYTYIPLAEICSIKRCNTLCAIEMKDGRIHNCFCSITYLESLLPATDFIRIKRELIVPLKSAPAYFS